MKRVAITGLGVISPIGGNTKDFWNALAAGKSGITPITNLTTDGLGIKFAAEIKGFDPAAHFEPKKLPMYDRFSQFALVAAREAVADSGLKFEGELAERSAVIVGTGIGGQTTIEESYTKLIGSGVPLGSQLIRVHPLTVPRTMPNAAGCQISMDHNITGPGYTIASACASATHAIGVVFHMIRAGTMMAGVTGGAEACLTYGTLKGWEALRVVAPDTCRPFSLGRGGMILGEGSGILVLEEWEHAKARGANIYAEMVGFGASSDAKDITTPDAGGMARAISGALKDACANPDAVDYINAHGTGTRSNDATESKAIHQVFGERGKKLPLSSNKSMFGHALGAAGALEMVAAALTLKNQVAPGTMNFTTPDPDCNLDIIPNAARAMPINLLLKNSFAFGGLNAVLAVKRV